MKYLVLFAIVIGFVSCQQEDKEKGQNEKVTEKQADTKVNITSDDVPESDYSFGDLPYSPDALEPHIDAFMNVIDWDEVSRRYNMAQDGKHYVPGKK